MTSGPEHSIMMNRRRIFNRFKLRQNAPLRDVFNFNLLGSSNVQKIVSNFGPINASLSDLVFKMISAIPTSKTSFHIAAECTIKRPRFENFLSSFNFQNIVSNSVRMHRLASLILDFSQQVHLPKHRFK